MKKILYWIIFFFFFLILGSLFLGSHNWGLLSQGIPYYFGDSPHLGPIAGDQLEMYYRSWLMKMNLEQGHSLAHDSYQFTLLSDRYLHFHISPMYVMCGILMLLFPDPLAFNIVFIFLPFILVGLCGFLFFRSCGCTQIASWTGAILLCLLPSRIGANVGGHIHGSIAFLFPLGFYFLAKIYLDQNYRFHWGLVLTLALAAFSDEHVAFYLALCLLFSGLFFLLSDWKQMRSGSFSSRVTSTIPLSTFVVAACICISVALVLKFWVYDASIKPIAWPLDEVKHYSLHITDYYRRVNKYFLGLLPILSVGLIWFCFFVENRISILKRMLFFHKRQWKVYLFFTLTLLFFFMVSWGFRDRWLEPIILFFLKHGSFFKYQRDLGRFAIACQPLFLLFFCLLLSLGQRLTVEAWKYSKQSRFFSVVLVILQLLMVGNLLFNYTEKGKRFGRVAMMLLTSESKLHEKVHDDQLSKKILTLPFVNAQDLPDAFGLYDILRTEKGSITGFFGAAPKEYGELKTYFSTLNQGLLTEKMYRDLLRFDVGYIFFRPFSYTLTKAYEVSPRLVLQLLRESPYLRELGSDQELYLFGVSTEAVNK